MHEFQNANFDTHFWRAVILCHMINDVYMKEFRFM